MLQGRGANLCGGYVMGGPIESALIEQCRRLIATPSVTTEGTRAVAELCAREILGPAGIDAQTVASPRHGPSQVNLRAQVPGADPSLPPLVLSTHLDTVSPGDPALWTECGGDPFNPTAAGDRLYGLGAADVKPDFLVKAMALAATPTPRRTVYLIGTFGEERGLLGAKELADSGTLPPGGLAFVGEPSGLAVISSHKGLAVFDLAIGFEPVREHAPLAPARLAVIGRAAHSSTPHLGDNAIVRALERLVQCPGAGVVSIRGGDAVNKVPARCEVTLAGAVAAQKFLSAVKNAIAVEMSPSDRVAEDGTLIPPATLALLAQFVRELDGFAANAGPPEPDYAPPTLTCNPAVLRSEAGGLRLQFELRLPPRLALGELRQGLYQLADTFADSALRSGFRWSLHEERANPAFRANVEGAALAAAMEALGRCGLPRRTAIKMGCTEAGVYAAAGLDPVVFGPGPSIGVIHAPNEYAVISELAAALNFYRELLVRA